MCRLEIAKLDWLLTDKVSSWPGTPKDRGWRYLRQCLERYDSAETDYSYNKAVLETFLSHDAAMPLPPWLIKTIRVSLWQVGFGPVTDDCAGTSFRIPNPNITALRKC